MSVFDEECLSPSTRDYLTQSTMSLYFTKLMLPPLNVGMYILLSHKLFYVQI